MSALTGPVATTTSHLDQQGMGYEVVEHDLAFTAAAEARAAGQEPANAVKSVLLRDLEGYELVVIQASDRLDLHKVREQLGESRSELRLASEEEMDADFPQFELGALPPLGEMLPAPEIVDRRVLDHDRVLCNAGDHTHSLLLDPREIVRASNADVADVRAD
ncbi:MAG TPA: YbaK/EbsC family protein [Solirubrobacterales bacterium]|nr:YbaK/EbsC family protein [Solirubrobacterales bacterium]